MFLLGLTMGMRLADISSVKPDDFCPSLEAPTYLRIVGKGNKERRVPVLSVVREALAVRLSLREVGLVGNKNLLTTGGEYVCRYLQICVRTISAYMAWYSGFQLRAAGLCVLC
jgi:site-specific recombinase XerC